MFPLLPAVGLAISGLGLYFTISRTKPIPTAVVQAAVAPQPANFTVALSTESQIQSTANDILKAAGHIPPISDTTIAAAQKIVSQFPKF